MADTALAADDTLSPAQIAAANPKGIPQAVDTPGGEPFDLTSAVTGNPRAQKALTDTVALYRRQIGELSAGERDQEQRASRYRDRMERMISQEGATASELKPWDAQQELAAHKTDLWSQFGSPGFVISMLASAFTAMPMNSALNAGAAAMNAINEGDMKAYDKSFAAWKENSQLTLDRLHQEQQEFADIDKLRESDLAEWQSKTRSLLAKFGDQRKLALLDNGYYPELLQAQDAEITSARDMAQARETLIQNHAVIESLNGHPAQEGEPVTHKDAKGTPMAGGDPRWYKGTDPLAAYTDVTRKITEAKSPYRIGSPDQQFAQRWWAENPNGTPAQFAEAFGAFKRAQHPVNPGPPTKEKEIARIQSELMAKDSKLSEADAYKRAAQEVEGAHKTLTPNEKIKQEAHLEQYDLVLTDILPEVEGILKRHVGSAGAAGYATRAAESVSNIFGGNDTDRRQFESDIDHLKLVAPNLLLDRTTGRPLSAEHEYIDKIIRGLNLGDTTANTLRSLAEVKRRLQALRIGVAKRIDSQDETPGMQTTPAAQPDPQWDQFPEVK